MAELNGNAYSTIVRSAVSSLTTTIKTNTSRAPIAANLRPTSQTAGADTARNTVVLARRESTEKPGAQKKGASRRLFELLDILEPHRKTDPHFPKRRSFRNVINAAIRESLKHIAPLII